MATGTGKTRTTIALIDLLLRAKRVQRVLFLADRRELVRQAMGEFKLHLPNESLARIEGARRRGARIQFATYPSMMQVYERLSVGHFDLIVADESHRSIYQRYRAIFEHFDAIHRLDCNADGLYRPQHVSALRLRRRSPKLLLQSMSKR